MAIARQEPSVMAEPTVKVALVLATAAVAWFAFGPLDRQHLGIRLVAPGLAALIAIGQWRIGGDRRLSRPARRFWRIMAVGMVMNTAGMLIDLGALLVTGPVTTSPPDPGAAVMYPVAGLFMLVALAIFPTARQTRTERAKLALDIATVLLGSATLVWYFLVGPHWRPSDGWLAVSERLILPVLLLVAGFIVLRVTMAGANVISRPTMVCFVVSVAFSILPLVIGAQAATESGRMGSAMHVLGLAVAYAGVAFQRRAGPGDPATARAGWRRPFTILPYGAVLAALALLLMIIAGDLDWRGWAVVVGNLALFTVVMARQVTSLWENSRLLSANRALATRLRHQAYHDHLTDLANRALFAERVTEALQRAGRDATGVAVLFVDLDDFKVINDSLGHQAGDELLVAVARRLRATVPLQDLLGRLGGDEFAVLVEGETDETVEAIAERVIGALGGPFALSGTQQHIKASVGIAISRHGEADADELLRNADVAMYAAKGAHKGCWRVFQPEMLASLLRRHELQAALVRAIQRDEFIVHYQPIVDLVDGTVQGAEALVRWQRADGAFVTPAQFVPLAEDTGLISDIDRSVLRQACHQAGRWRAELPPQMPLTMHVNVSARQLHRPGLVDEVRRTLWESGLPAECLTLEITESGLGQDAEAAIERLGELSRLGVHLAIDDFGTGYSSLAYLRRMPVDVLKIDKSFVDELAGDASDGAPLAQAVIALAATLGMRTVAEGIEEGVQARRLVEMECRYGQGYHFGRPMPAERMGELLRSAAARPRINGTGHLVPLAASSGGVAP
jgi:diguanylate cyclase